MAFHGLLASYTLFLSFVIQKIKYLYDKNKPAIIKNFSLSLFDSRSFSLEFQEIENVQI